MLWAITLTLWWCDFWPFWCFLFLPPIALSYDNCVIWLFWPLYIIYVSPASCTSVTCSSEQRLKKSDGMLNLIIYICSELFTIFYDNTGIKKTPNLDPFSETVSRLPDWLDSSHPKSELYNACSSESTLGIQIQYSVLLPTYHCFIIVVQKLEWVNWAEINSLWSQMYSLAIKCSWCSVDKSCC